MRARIAEHKARRGGRWRSIEAPVAAADVLRALPPESGVVLIDCLTLWLSNLMHAGRDIGAETAEMLAALQAVVARERVVEGKSGSIRVAFGGRRLNKKK